MRWISRARRMLALQRATGSPRLRPWPFAGVSAAVGVVVLVVLAVGMVAGGGGPSRAGAEGLGSNAFSPGRTTTLVDPCEVYGSRRILEFPLLHPEFWEHHWADRVPTLRSGGREIVFADGNAVYAASVDGTQLWRPVREDAAFYVGGRSRYVLQGFVSLGISSVDGALVYATCWSYMPDGSDPEIARCINRVPIPRYCFQTPPHFGRVRLAFPSGDVDFPVGQDLYELTVVRPEAGTVNRLYLGNFPTWSPDGRRIAFVSAYWRTADRSAAGPLSRVTRVDRLAPAGSDLQSRVQIMAADGTDLRTIELPPGMHADYPPRWSPDGTRLAFVVTEEAQGDPTSAIYTVGADGTGLQRLREARSNPAWSPDGMRLAFAKSNGDPLHLYTMAADGTGVRQISSMPGGSLGAGVGWVPTLAWSPDGSRLLYGCFDLVCVVGLDGQPVGEFGYQHPAQLPAWSADGRRIALYAAAPASGSRDEVVLASVAPDGTDRRVLVRQRAGQLVADQAENFVFPGPVATQEACTAGVVVPAPAQHPGLVGDCEALVALRAELFGRAGTNWTTNTPLGEWEGMVVGGAPARVRALVLGDGSIGRFDHGGRLPAGIAELTALERLELSRNRLTGRFRRHGER